MLCANGHELLLYVDVEMLSVSSSWKGGVVTLQGKICVGLVFLQSIFTVLLMPKQSPC